MTATSIPLMEVDGIPSSKSFLAEHNTNFKLFLTKSKLWSLFASSIGLLP